MALSPMQSALGSTNSMECDMLGPLHIVTSEECNVFQKGKSEWSVRSTCSASCISLVHQPHS